MSLVGTAPDAQVSTFPGRLAIQQRVLPAYRAGFLEALAKACDSGLSVLAGKPTPQEGILPAERLQSVQYTPIENRTIFPVTSPLHQCWQPGLLEWLESSDPDVLIVDANPRLASNPQAVRWMHARGRPVLAWGLGAPLYRARSSLGQLLVPFREERRRRMLRSYDGWIAYSRRGAAEYRALGLPSERVFVAPNAVAFRPINPEPDRPARSVERPVVLFVGRLQARKRIDNLLWACAALPAAKQPELWIVGDGPARSDFEALAVESYPKARFFGAKRGAELETLFKAADLFVLPGTGGLAAQQAMSYALPLVVAQGDGTQEDILPTEETSQEGRVVQAQNGWRIAPEDPQALQQALQEALSDPARLQKMGSESFRLIKEEINVESMVAAFLFAVRRLLGGV